MLLSTKYSFIFPKNNYKRNLIQTSHFFNYEKVFVTLAEVIIFYISPNVLYIYGFNFKEFFLYIYLKLINFYRSLRQFKIAADTLNIFF